MIWEPSCEPQTCKIIEKHVFFFNAFGIELEENFTRHDNRGNLVEIRHIVMASAEQPTMAEQAKIIGDNEFEQCVREKMKAAPHSFKVIFADNELKKDKEYECGPHTFGPFVVQLMTGDKRPKKVQMQFAKKMKAIMTCEREVADGEWEPYRKQKPLEQKEYSREGKEGDIAYAEGFYFRAFTVHEPGSYRLKVEGMGKRDDFKPE